MFEHIALEPLLLTIFACTGFWGVVSILVQYFLNKRDTESEAQKKMNKLVLGLGHDRICFLGMAYVDRGYITKDEYEDLVTYLYKPYVDLGGNGTAELVIKKVEELPVTSSKEVSSMAATQLQGVNKAASPDRNIYQNIKHNPMNFD